MAAPPRAYVLALRGRVDAAREAMAGIVSHARDIVDPQIVAPAVTVAAFIALLEGDAQSARELALEASTLPGSGGPEMIVEKARILIVSGEEEHAYPPVEHVLEPTRSANARVAVRAMLAEVTGDTQTAAVLYDDAAGRWRAFGNPFELAHALAGRARCLRTIGSDAEAEPFATEAASLFRGLGVDEHVLATTGWPPNGRAGGVATR